MTFSIVKRVAAAGGGFANPTGTPDSSIVSMIGLPGWTPGLPANERSFPAPPIALPPGGVADIGLGLEGGMASIRHVGG